jgi:hypothetical protein
MRMECRFDCHLLPSLIICGASVSINVLSNMVVTIVMTGWVAVAKVEKNGRNSGRDVMGNHSVHFHSMQYCIVVRYIILRYIIIGQMISQVLLRSDYFDKQGSHPRSKRETYPRLLSQYLALARQRSYMLNSLVGEVKETAPVLRYNKYFVLEYHRGDEICTTISCSSIVI